MSSKSASVTERVVVHSGELFKKGKINTAWQQRFFVLYSDRTLSWFKTEKDAHSDKAAKNEADLSHVQSISLVPTKAEFRELEPSASISGSRSWTWSAKKASASSSSDADMSALAALDALETPKKIRTGKISVTLGSPPTAPGILPGPGFKSPSVSTTTSASFGSSTASLSPTSCRSIGYEEFSRRTQYVDKSFAFEIVTAKRTYVLAAADVLELAHWRHHLEKVVFGSRFHAGWLTKRGAMRKTWRRRWFVLFDTGEMRYYDGVAMKQDRGTIRLNRDNVLLMCPGDAEQYTQPFTIQLLTQERNWVLAADSEEERSEWVSKLEEVICGAKKLITAFEGYMWKRTSAAPRTQTQLLMKAVTSFTSDEGDLDEGDLDERDLDVSETLDGRVAAGKVAYGHWKKRYFALSKGFLFYFDSEFHCRKFASIIFFSETFFNQAFRLYVKGNIPLQHTTVQRVETGDRANTFVIRTDKRKKFFFACETKDELKNWFHEFRKAQRSGFGSRVAGDEDLLKSPAVRSLRDSDPTLLKSLSSELPDISGHMAVHSHDDDEVKAQMPATGTGLVAAGDAGTVVPADIIGIDIGSVAVADSGTVAVTTVAAIDSGVVTVADAGIETVTGSSKAMTILGMGVHASESGEETKVEERSAAIVSESYTSPLMTAIASVESVPYTLDDVSFDAILDIMDGLDLSSSEGEDYGGDAKTEDSSSFDEGLVASSLSLSMDMLKKKKLQRGKKGLTRSERTSTAVLCLLNRRVDGSWADLEDPVVMQRQAALLKVDEGEEHDADSAEQWD